jgi:integrase
VSDETTEIVLVKVRMLDRPRPRSQIRYMRKTVGRKAPVRANGAASSEEGSYQRSNKVQGWVAENVVADVPKAKVRGSAIGILSVDELARLLENAAPETLPYWAFGAFCGVRSAELDRLEWKDVHWESKLLEIAASKSKTASRRFVELRPNVLAWLAPYRKHKGRVCPKMLRKRLEADRATAKITDWKPNCLRHSFASYHLAHFKNANALALEMGHTDSDLIFSNYRQLVLPIEAAKFWKLAPAAKSSKKVVAFA